MEFRVDAVAWLGAFLALGTGLGPAAFVRGTVWIEHAQGYLPGMLCDRMMI